MWPVASILDSSDWDISPTEISHKPLNGVVEALCVTSQPCVDLHIVISTFIFSYEW